MRRRRGETSPATHFLDFLQVGSIIRMCSSVELNVKPLNAIGKKKRRLTIQGKTRSTEVSSSAERNLWDKQWNRYRGFHAPFFYLRTFASDRDSYGLLKPILVILCCTTEQRRVPRGRLTCFHVYWMPQRHRTFRRSEGPDDWPSRDGMAAANNSIVVYGEEQPLNSPIQWPGRDVGICLPCL